MPAAPIADDNNNNNGNNTTTNPDDPAVLPAAWTRLRDMVAARTPVDGRTDALYPGLRCYRFSHPIRYEKTQRLTPGVVVVLQGRKTAYLGGDRSLAYGATQCLVLGAEVACLGTVVGASAAAPYLAIHLDLPPDVLVKSVLALAEGGGGDGVAGPGDAPPAEPARVREHFTAPVGPEVVEAFARLLLAADDPVDRRTLAPLAVEEIVLRLLRSEAAAAIRSASAVTKAGARIQAAIGFMRRHLGRPLSVAEIASHVHMSPSHFAHSFREVAGVTPMRCIRDLRLEEARSLMLATGLRPGDAAAQVGFESAAHFNRAFRRRFEATPAEYVRRMQAG
ncbi:AraC-like DNA-binding protein [Variovorax boronicumulans]|uniref:AraC-like DNA-binding protein n=1 Tax=Variovorax boronicumulans TaxID=436515 RepID=A0AAW8DAB8_9BURK|nr:AraC family transcriptional regulator [Variovorax boronicumulans]MDP9896892.1 AraC-like DNA-binding protein [Variovorax boronicumulans]MDQ0057011.1 AraC-like DNA-binding protein [Variovorax boronicumulans]